MSIFYISVSPHGPCGLGLANQLLKVPKADSCVLTKNVFEILGECPKECTNGLCIKEDTCACDVGFQGNQCNQPVKKGNAIKVMLLSVLKPFFEKDQHTSKVTCTHCSK